jgi:hypothetical protein
MQLKVTSKERDVAVGTLSQFKSDSSHRDHQLKLQLERKEEELRQLQNK